MSLLKGLVVKKVSFVRSAANKRKFVLLKSADSMTDNSNDDSNDGNDSNNDGGFKMRPEIKTALVALLKKKVSADQVVVQMKSDSTLALTKADEDAVALFLEIHGEVPEKVVEVEKIVEKTVTVEKATNANSTDALTILQASLTTMQNENRKLAERIEAASLITRRNELLTIVKEKCAFVPSKAEDIVTHVMKLEKTDADAAQFFLDSQIKASSALEASYTFGEIGSSRTGDQDGNNDSPEGVYLRDIAKTQGDLRKSGVKQSQFEIIADAIKRGGGRAWAQYRLEHIRRAKTSVSG